MMYQGRLDKIKTWPSTTQWNDMPAHMGSVDDDTFFETSYDHHPSSVCNDPRLMWRDTICTHGTNRAIQYERRAHEFAKLHTHGEELTQRVDQVMGSLGTSYEDAIAEALSLSSVPSISELYEGDSDGNPLAKREIYLLNTIDDLSQLSYLVSQSKYPFISVSVQTETRYSMSQFVQCIAIATMEALIVIDPFNMYTSTALHMALADIFQDYSLLKIIGMTSSDFGVSRLPVRVLESEFDICLVNVFDFGMMCYQRFLRCNPSSDEGQKPTHSTGDGGGLDRFIATATDENANLDMPSVAQPTYKALLNDHSPLFNFSERPINSDKYVYLHRETQYLLHAFWLSRIVLNQSAYFSTRINGTSEINTPMLAAAGGVLNGLDVSKINKYDKMIGASATRPWLWEHKALERLKQHKKSVTTGVTGKYGDAFLQLWLQGNDPGEERNYYHQNVPLYKLRSSPYMSDPVFAELMQDIAKFRDKLAYIHDINSEWLMSTWELFDQAVANYSKNNNVERGAPFARWTPNEQDFKHYPWLNVDLPRSSHSKMIDLVVMPPEKYRLVYTQILRHLETKCDELKLKHRSSNNATQYSNKYHGQMQRNSAYTQSQNKPKTMHPDHQARLDQRHPPHQHPRILHDGRHGHAPTSYVHKHYDHRHEEWRILPEDPEGIVTFRERVPKNILEYFLQPRKPNYSTEELIKEGNAFISYLKLCVRSPSVMDKLSDVVDSFVPIGKRLSSKLAEEGFKELFDTAEALSKRVVQWGRNRPQQGMAGFIVISVDQTLSNNKVYSLLKIDRKTTNSFGLVQAQSPLIDALTRWSNEGLIKARAHGQCPHSTAIYYNVPFSDTQPSQSRSRIQDNQLKDRLKQIKFETAIALFKLELERQKNKHHQMAKLPWFYVVPKVISEKEIQVERVYPRDH